MRVIRLTQNLIFWTAVMRTLPYWKDTNDFSLHYHRHSSQHYPEYEQSKRPSMTGVKQRFAYAFSYIPGNAKISLTGFSEADFANNMNDSRSITGYVFYLAGAPLMFKKSQNLKRY